MSYSENLYLFNQQRYFDQVVPAFERFKQAKDVSRLVNLLEEAQRLLPALETQDGIPLYTSQSSILSDIDILTGKEFYSRAGNYQSKSKKTSAEDLHAYIYDSIACELITIFCIPRGLGFEPNLDVGNSPLYHLLMQTSPAISAFLEFREPFQKMPVKIAPEKANILARWEDLPKWKAEIEILKKVVSDEQIESELAQLFRMLEHCQVNPDYTIFGSFE